jgi:hypothetical protein
MMILEVLFLLPMFCMAQADTKAREMEIHLPEFEKQDTLTQDRHSSHHMQMADTIQNKTFLDSLKTLESEINNRIHKLKIPDSLSSKTDLMQLIGQDSMLISLLQRYNQYAVAYDLPSASLQELLDLPEGFQDADIRSLLSDINLGDIKGLQDIPGQTGQIREEIDAQVSNFQGMDETIARQAEKLEEVQYFDEQKDGFSEIGDQLEQYTDPELVKKQLAAKKKALANNALLSNLDKANIPTKTIKKFQNKYRRFNSANDVASGKENPLKHQPGKRLVYGANFQMNPSAPVSVDISPLLGYRITNLWTIGTGGSVRYRLDPKDDFRLPNSGNIVYGFRAFSQYRAIKSFYFHAEYESFNRPFKEVRQWNNQALAGIGREFAVIKSIKGNVSVLYNFLHDEKSPYSHPVVFRFGFVRKKG